jgi:hypothetical protein
MDNHVGLCFMVHRECDQEGENARDKEEIDSTLPRGNPDNAYGQGLM